MLSCILKLAGNICWHFPFAVVGFSENNRTHSVLLFCFITLLFLWCWQDCGTLFALFWMVICSLGHLFAVLGKNIRRMGWSAPIIQGCQGFSEVFWAVSWDLMDWPWKPSSSDCILPLSHLLPVIFKTKQIKCTFFRYNFSYKITWWYHTWLHTAGLQGGLIWKQIFEEYIVFPWPFLFLILKIMV